MDQLLIFPLRCAQCVSMSLSRDDPARYDAVLAEAVDDFDELAFQEQVGILKQNTVDLAGGEGWV